MAVGQTYSPPTHAAMILSLEGVFASVASYTFLDETLSYRELSGCALMLLATLIAKVGVRCMDQKTGTCLLLRLFIIEMKCASSILPTGDI